MLFGKLLSAAEQAPSASPHQIAGLNDKTRAILTEQDITSLEQLLMLTASDLNGLGLTVGQRNILKRVIADSKVNGDDTHDGGDVDDPCEWFEDGKTLQYLRESCRQLRLLKANNPKANLKIVVGYVEKASPAEGTKPKKCDLGDVILDHNGVFRIVTSHFPCPPTVTLTVVKQAITVKIEPAPNAVLPPTNFVVLFRPVPNPVQDGIRDVDVTGHQFEEKLVTPTQTVDVTLEPLLDNTDYEVKVLVETAVGRSPTSDLKTVRTEKLDTPAIQLINFFEANRKNLARSKRMRDGATAVTLGRKSWEYDEGKGMLFLGTTTTAIRYASTNPQSEREIAVLFVDVAPEFMPKIEGAEFHDEKTMVLVFCGPTGHGKTTQINAFVSFLLRGALTDPMRVVLVDLEALDHSLFCSLLSSTWD